ncbi:MAG: hypothetical protein H0V01_15665 [Bacteroidetes bacterium]|nr:hypothetical protein [Bacteroidota bacterium]HET6244138.1 hypothetical protein [Bacteroidia bacterium]
MKKTIATIFSILFFTVAGLGQETEKRNVGWQTGFSIMPTIAYNHGTSKRIDYTNVIGLRVEGTISKRLNIISGLSYFKTDLFNGRWHGAPCASPMEDCYWYSKRT